MPAYNQSAFLRQAIDSVVSQTYEDWELVVVDDGSTDATPEQLERISDARIITHRQSNRGCPSALNAAFRLSRGDFIVILASDDWLLPDALRLRVGAMERHPDTDIVYTDGYVADRDGACLVSLSGYRQAPFGDSLESFVIASPIVGVHSAMLRRSALECEQGPFDEQMLGYEDWDLFIRLKAAGRRFLYLPEHTCCYRFHGQNKSAPRSGLAERRRQALVHSRLRVLNASWFDTLSLPARTRFFHDLLTGALREDDAGQRDVLAHPSLAALPSRERSEILYYLAVENLVVGADRSREWRRLVQVARLRPRDPRPYLLLATFFLGARLQQGVIRTRRKIQARGGESDPVADILRAANVA